MKRWESTSYSGYGAKIVGGRWNQKGVPVVYTSGTRSLAALELLVHTDPGLLPDDLVVTPADLADVDVETFDRSSLPANWRDVPAPEALAELGVEWVRSVRSVALKVPSVVVPDEYNILLNPLHPDFAKVKVLPGRPFTLDPRYRRFTP